MISAIVAHSLNYAIGKNNSLPWKMSSDLQNFKKLTLAKNILMGRKTFESIGKALPGRNNFVLTRDQSFRADGVTVFHSLPEVLDFQKGEIIICGGSEIYKIFLPYIKTFYISCIHAQVENADAFFPKLSEKEWIQKSTQTFEKGAKDDFSWDFSVWERK